MPKRRYLFPFFAAIGFAAFLLWSTLSDQSEALGTTHFAMQGKTVPEFTLTSLERGDIVDATLFSNDWTLLNVWASWCSSCKAEHNYLMQLAHEQDIPIIGLNYRDDRNNALRVLSATGNPYQRVIFDPKGSLALDLGSIVTPETYLIAPNGVIQFRHSGVLNDDIWQTHFVPRLSKFNMAKPSNVARNQSEQ